MTAFPLAAGLIILGVVFIIALGALAVLLLMWIGQFFFTGGKLEQED